MGVIRQAKDGHYYERRRTYGGRFYTVQHGSKPPSAFGPLIAIGVTVGLFVVPLLLASIPRAFQAEIDLRKQEAVELRQPNLSLPQ